MNAIEILAAFRTARALMDLGLSQYNLAKQSGQLTDEQKAAILTAAQLTDDQVDDAITAARKRLAIHQQTFGN